MKKKDKKEKIGKVFEDDSLLDGDWGEEYDNMVKWREEHPKETEILDEYSLKTSGMDIPKERELFMKYKSEAMEKLGVDNHPDFDRLFLQYEGLTQNDIKFFEDIWGEKF